MKSIVDLIIAFCLESSLSGAGFYYNGWLGWFEGTFLAIAIFLMYFNLNSKRGKK